MIESLEITYSDDMYLEFNTYTEVINITDSEINYKKEYTGNIDYSIDDVDDIYYKVRNKMGTFKLFKEALFNLCRKIESVSDFDDSMAILHFKFEDSEIGEIHFYFDLISQIDELDLICGLFTEYLPLEVGLPTFCESDLTLDDDEVLDEEFDDDFDYEDDDYDYDSDSDDGIYLKDDVEF